MKLNYKRTSRGKIKITVQCTRGLQVQQGSTSWAIRHSLQWVGTWFGMSLTQPTIHAILVRQSQMIHPLMTTHIAHWLAHTIQSTHSIHQHKRNTTYFCYSQIQMFWRWIFVHNDISYLHILGQYQHCNYYLSVTSIKNETGNS